jgi:two-component system NtrC family sensor kinase
MIRFGFRRLALVLLGVLLLIAVSACGTAPRSDAAASVPLAGRIEILEDRDGTLPLEEVVSPARANDFQKRPGPVNLGVSGSVFWFRLTLDPGDFTKGARASVISLGDYFDEVSAFVGGDDASAEQWRPLPVADFAINGTAPAAFELPAHVRGAARLLFRGYSADTLVFAPRVEAAVDYVERNDAETLRKGAYYGVLIGAIIYNLFLAIWLRDRTYVLYVIFEAAFCGTVACMDRTLIAVFPAMLPLLQHGLSERFMSLTGMVAVLFARDFLDLQTSPRIRVAAIVTLVCGVVLIAFPDSLGRQLLYAASYFYILYTTSLLAVMVVLSLRRGNANAGLFLTAWGAVLLATMLGAFANLGVLTPAYSVIDSLRLGSAVEALLLAIALARRMNRIKEAEAGARSELAEARLGLSKVLQRQISSLNTLVGGVAHEIGNPLNFATGGARDVIDRIRKADAIAEEISSGSTSQTASLRDILAAAGRSAALAARGTERIDNIVKNLRTYVGSGALPLELTDLDDCIRSTVALLEAHLLARKIDVALDLGLRNRVRCCPTEMNQVVMNLMLNASQAMPEGGTITIRTEETAAGVRVVITDTGPGVPPSLRQAIFDPFFTTRGPNEGTGLGLAVSTEIARRHGGSLELLACGESERGAAFALHLPRTP